MLKENDTKLLLQTVYLTLQQFGHQEVSLKNPDLLEYVPKIEIILKENGFDDADLFLKTPVEESYDKYKNFLISELYGKGLGYFNENYDIIILNCPLFYILNCQKAIKPYSEIVHRCCYAISGDIQFIEDDTIFEVLSLTKRMKEKNKSKILFRNGC